MRKKIFWTMGIGLLTGLLGGCGTSYDADTNTLFIKSNGKIIETSVEQFDQVDEEVLEQFVDEELSSYCEEQDVSIKEKEFTIEENIAKITLEYESSEDYAGFHNKEFFVGTVVQALAAGYSIPVDFDSEDKIIILEENVTVKLSGEVKTTTDNAKVTEDGTVVVTGYEEDDSNPGITYIIYQ